MESKHRIEGYKKLIELAKVLGWSYYLDDIMKAARVDNQVSNALANIINEYNNNKPNLAQQESSESFFAKLSLKDLQAQGARIRDQATTFYNSGNFLLFNSIFTKFVKNLRELSQADMNNFIIQYVISSTMKRNFENAIADILSLKQYYPNYDLNIYVYLLHFFSGNLNESSSYLININHNIYHKVYDMCSSDELTQYVVLSLLVNFRRETFKEIQINTNCLIYKFYDDNPVAFEILENFSKCKYSLVVSNIDSILKKADSDPVLSTMKGKISFDSKFNILIEIISAASAVSIDYLSVVLKEKPEVVENWILQGILEGSLKVRIDDIAKIVYSIQKKEQKEIMIKTINFAKANYMNCLKNISSKLSKNIELPKIDKEYLKVYGKESGGMGGVGGVGNLIDLLRMAGATQFD
jgi:hypothetical protein